MLGFTQISWDNISGKEKQPSPMAKSWTKLKHDERYAAVALGFTGDSWDNFSGKEKQPDAMAKKWAELATCGECPSI